MPDRPPRTHICLIDGTFSRIVEGQETNVGLTYRLLEEVGQTMGQSVFYHPGVQGQGWGKWLAAAAGIGINEAMAEAYAVLCSRYKPGDRIVLLGYSRGAYAVRSLAGWIGQVGLLKTRHATARRIARSFRYYQQVQLSDAGRRFGQMFCHRDVQIEMLGVWDTVRALGLPYPLLNRLVPMVTDFHNDGIGDNVAHAFHALALDETREAYDPVLWLPSKSWAGRMEQVWFPGNHGDVGGHVWRKPAARGLSNIPLNWMLERLGACGVTLPDNWRSRFPEDVAAPSVGNWRGSAKLFLFRTPRLVQPGAHETIHESVAARSAAWPRYRPKAEMCPTDLRCALKQRETGVQPA